MRRRWRRWTSPASGRRLGAALLGPGAVTLLATAREHPPTAVVSVLYVLAVVVAARVGGAVAGLAAAAVSFLALNFFFTPPLHTLEVGAAADVVALFVFLVAAVIVGVLFSSVVEARARAERSDLEARLLNRLATRLLSGDATEEVLEAFAGELCDTLDVAACEITTGFTRPARVMRTPPDGSAHEVRLTARGVDIGRLKLWPGAAGALSGDERRMVNSLAPQLALALEGVRLSVEVRKAELDAHSSRLKADLFSGVTHDVKTPLAAITTSVTSLLDGGGFSDTDRREHLETIRQEADRLHRVVNNLLDVARLRAGGLVPAKVPTAIDELMEGVLNRLRPLLGDRPVDMHIDDDVPVVPMDVVQIDQVLTNLIENAVKFSPPATPITLRAVGGPDRVRVSVCDRGPGIPGRDRKRIFEPFERGAGPVAGTGLGLTISNAIVAAHGGRMWVSETPGGGSAFTFELPRPDGVDGEVSDAGARARR